MMKITVYFIVTTLLLVALSSCTSPARQRGSAAPVVDRTSVFDNNRPVAKVTSPNRNVQVTPLEREIPIESEQNFETIVLQEAEQALPTAPVVKPKPGPDPKPASSRDTGKSNKAVYALLESAANHLGTGQLDKAAADVERALRIEPKDAAIWYDLAQIRMAQQQYVQAEAMASKSNSLAPADRSLQLLNWELIAQARRLQGDTIGADAAEAKAALLK